MNDLKTIADLIAAVATPAGIAAFALWLLREEAHRNADAMKQIIDGYRQTITNNTNAIAKLTQLIQDQKE